MSRGRYYRTTCSVAELLCGGCQNRGGWVQRRGHRRHAALGGVRLEPRSTQPRPMPRVIRTEAWRAARPETPAAVAPTGIQPTAAPGGNDQNSGGGGGANGGSGGQGGNTWNSNLSVGGFRGHRVSRQHQPCGPRRRRRRREQQQQQQHPVQQRSGGRRHRDDSGRKPDRHRHHYRQWRGRLQHHSPTTAAAAAARAAASSFSPAAAGKLVLQLQAHGRPRRRCMGRWGQRHSQSARPWRRRRRRSCADFRVPPANLTVTGGANGVT